jgi:hypothetical protein
LRFYAISEQKSQVPVIHSTTRGFPCFLAVLARRGGGGGDRVQRSESMARVVENRLVLEKFVNAKSKRDRTRIIKNGGLEIVKTFFEIIENSLNLPLSKTEEKDIQRCKTTIKEFFKRKWNIPKFTKLIIDQSRQLAILTSLTLLKFEEGRTCSFLQQQQQQQDEDGDYE